MKMRFGYVLFLALWGTGVVPHTQAGITQSLSRCFSTPKPHCKPLNFTGLSPLEVLSLITDEYKFKLTPLSDGAYGTTRLSTRYLTETKEKRSLRGRYRRKVRVETETNEKYVIKEETRKSTKLREEGKDNTFSNEARLLLKMQPGNLVVDLVAYGSHQNGSDFLITRFGGYDLNLAAMSGKLKINKKTEKLLHQFLFTVQSALMKNHISYLDWKPENIVVETTGNKPRFRLIDFGLAEEFSSQWSDTFAGTAATAAPEIFLEHHDQDYLISPANSYAIGATAISFHRLRDKNLSQALSDIWDTDSHIDSEKYQTYQQILLNPAGLPDYILDLVHPEPSQRLFCEEGTGLWKKLTPTGVDSFFVEQNFDPYTFTYDQGRIVFRSPEEEKAG